MHAPIGDVAIRLEWFAAVAEVAAEFRALAALERSGVEAWLPTMTCRRLVRGRMVEASRPLFPRYLFVKAPPWRLSEVIAGGDILGILPLGRLPQAIDENVVDTLREREAAGEFYYREDTKTGRRKRRKAFAA
jgi:transcriptional antiterminator RfaH